MTSRIAAWLGAASFGLLVMSSSAMAYQGMTSTAATMRAAPGSRSKVVMRIPPGALIDVQSCTQTWCRISWRYRVGYIPAIAVEDVQEDEGPIYVGPPPVYVAPPPVVVSPFWGPGWGPGWGGPGWGGRHRR